MSRAPRGFYVFCGAVSAAAGVVIAVNLLHHPGGAFARAAGPHQVVSASPATTPGMSLPAAPPGASMSAAGAAGGQGAPRSAPVGSGSSAPARGPEPSPHPSPAGGAVQVGAAVAVSLRGTTPVSVRLPLAVPTGPPWPPLVGLGVGVR